MRNKIELTKNTGMAQPVKRGRPRKSGNMLEDSDAPKTKLRKLIDLPVEALPKLNALAAAEGKSLKSYIEWLAIEKAKTVKGNKLPASARRVIRK